VKGKLAAALAAGAVIAVLSVGGSGHAAPAFYAAGEGINAGNTGLAVDHPVSLTPVGSVTYGPAYNGRTITDKAYHGEVDITGSHITIKDCSLTNGGLNSVGFLMQGSYDVVENCTITSPKGESMYEPVWVFGTGNQVARNNISRGENALTTYGTNVMIKHNYMHDASLASNPSDHPDSIEVYGGGGVTIWGNRLEEDNLYDSPVNVAPYSGWTLRGLTVIDNFIDDGQSNILVDNQSNDRSKGVEGVRILHNAFGGHQCPSSNVYCFYIYHSFLNEQGRPTVQTDAQLTANPTAVEWPTSGPEVNRWEENTSASPDGMGRPQVTLSPDKDGQVAQP
jgi:hypothetical protein